MDSSNKTRGCARGYSPSAKSLLIIAEERHILDRCREGDRYAFDQLISLYEERVYKFALRLSGDREDANDIAADVFVRVYRSINKFRGESAFITWLFRIVTNTYLDTLKRKSNRMIKSFSEFVDHDEDLAVFNQAVDPAPQPLQQAEWRERNEMLHMAISELPEYQRDLIVLFHLKHHSYDDIAYDLGLPLGTVKSRLNRARMTLKEALRPHREHFVV
jgi:RNA polymerase sigma-70 factor (ECF subfamily)